MPVQTMTHFPLWKQMCIRDRDAIHAVRLKQKSKTKRKKKIAAAIYEYQADCDGEWGEICLLYTSSDVSLRLHEIKDIVVVTLDRFPVFPDTVTLRKLKVVGNKPL